MIEKVKSIEKFNLSEKERHDLDLLTTRVVIGSDRLPDFLEKISKVIKQDKQTLVNLAIIIANEVFLPLKNEIGDVEGFIKLLGGEIKTSGISNTSKINDDEEEIKNIKSLNNSSLPMNYDQAASEIIVKFNYIEKDEIYQKRLKNIIIARLRDVRDELETVETLTKNKKIGGLEFNADQVSALLKIIKTYDGKLAKEEKKELPPQLKSIIESNIDYVIPQAQQFIKNTTVNEAIKTSSPELFIEEEDGLPVLKMPQEIIAKPLVNSPSKIPADKNLDFNLKPAVKEEDQKEVIQEKVIAPQPTPVMSKASFPAKLFNNSKKPNLDDIKLVRKTLGPIEELAEMTLIDFRRISNDPIQATEKIKEKVGLLEKESYAKRIEGIDAWHKSEVNRFYRLLGQASMSEGKSIEQIISERLEANKPTLSLQEFEAIMELNQKLRF